MIFRPSTLLELEALFFIEQKCFDHDILPKIAFKYYILHKTDLIYSILLDKTIIGFFIIKMSKNKTIAFLEKLAIDPYYQNIGLGKQVLEYIENLVKDLNIYKIRLQTEEKNKKLVDFYTVNGYKVINILPSIYDNGLTALNMEKVLDNEGSSNR